MKCFRMLTAVALMAGPAFADEAGKTAADCAGIRDDAARLACYDRLADPSPPAVESVDPTPPAVEVRDETAAAAGEPEPGAARGLLKRVLSFGRRTPESQAPVSAGEIVQIQQLVRGNYQITLDNGEVWRENEHEPWTSYEVGDRIVVRRGVLGTYNLDNERNRQRVKVQPVR